MAKDYQNMRRAILPSGVCVPVADPFRIVSDDVWSSLCINPVHIPQQTINAEREKTKPASTEHPNVFSLFPILHEMLLTKACRDVRAVMFERFEERRRAGDKLTCIVNLGHVETALDQMRSCLREMKTLFDRVDEFDWKGRRKGEVMHDVKVRDGLR